MPEPFRGAIALPVNTARYTDTPPSRGCARVPRLGQGLGVANSRFLNASRLREAAWTIREPRPTKVGQAFSTAANADRSMGARSPFLLMTIFSSPSQLAMDRSSAATACTKVFGSV